MTHSQVVCTAEIRLWIRHNLLMIENRSKSYSARPEFPSLLSCLRCNRAARVTSLFPLTRLDRRPFCFSQDVSTFVLFFFKALHRFSLCVHCDMVVLACSLEHKMLSLQAAGLWYSTWRLTASHTVSAFDDSAFVPATVFRYFTVNTDCDCAAS